MENKLTAREVQTASLPPGKKEHFLPDGGGLYLRMRPTAKGVVSKTWIYRFTHQGSPDRMQLGVYSETQMTLAKAREARNAARELVAGGQNPKLVREAEEAKAKADALSKKLLNKPKTVEDLFYQWVERYATLHRADKGAGVLAHFNNHLKPLLGAMPLGELTTAHISFAISDILAKGRKKPPRFGRQTDGRGLSRTAGIVLTSLKSAFSWGYGLGLIDSNPAAVLQPKKLVGPDNKRKRVLSAAEIKLLYHLIENSTLTPRWRHAIWVMLACGTRVEEMTLAEVAHVDLNAKTWHIPAENQKQLNGEPPPKDHLVALSPFALAHMRALIAMSRQTPDDDADTKRKKKASSATKDGGTDGESVKHNKYLFPARVKKDQQEAPADKGSLAHMIADRQKPDEALQPGRTQNSDELVLPGGPWNTHDLRRTMATGMGELHVRPDVIDRCQSHIVGNEVSQRYQLQELRELMTQAWMVWGDRLATLVDEAKADEPTANAIREVAQARQRARKQAAAAKAKKTKAERRRAIQLSNMEKR